MGRRYIVNSSHVLFVQSEIRCLASTFRVTDYAKHVMPGKIAKATKAEKTVKLDTEGGYALVDKDTGEILKFGETLYPDTRYPKAYLEEINAVIKY